MCVPVGICTFSFGYVTGGLGRGTEDENPAPLDGDGLIDLAIENGLTGVECPASMFGDGSDTALREVRNRLEANGLHVVIDGGQVLRQDFETLIHAAEVIGARTVRVVLSGVLCGDRSRLNGTWEDHLEACLNALRMAEPIARAHDVAIAVENHQDATSDDLLHLCETIGSPYVGVNLDAANPLAVGEDPIEFAERIGPYLKNVHLKDYLMVRSPSGYRLVRCAVGDGVVDWPALFDLLARVAPNATRSIELGAMQERHVRLFEPAWWAYYPPRDARTLLGPLRLLAEAGRSPDADYRSPWDRGEGGHAQYDYEMAQFERSVRYLGALLS